MKTVADNWLPVWPLSVIMALILMGPVTPSGRASMSV